VLKPTLHRGCDGARAGVRAASPSDDLPKTWQEAASCAGHTALMYDHARRPQARPWRKCRGCRAVIRQPRAGRPQRWCSRLCYQRATRDRAADAARNRGRWAELAETERDQRRAAMRARWAALSAQERAELAARRRQRRQLARVAS